MKHFIGLLTAVLFVLSQSGYAQKYTGGIPFLQNYSHEEYEGENQNFAITQDDRGVLYFANNKSILEFDGKNWRQIFLPEKETIYALGKSNEGRIYVGASKGELGYLAANKKGQMEYQSLKDKLPKEQADFNLIRDIVFSQDGNVLFVSPLDIYIYDKDTFHIHSVYEDERQSDNRFVFSFQFDEQTYVQERGNGILKYEKGKFDLIPGSEIFANIWISGMFPSNTDSIYLTTFYPQDKDYLLFNGTFYEKEDRPLPNTIYKNTKHNDNTYILGLYDGGIVFTDKALNVKKYLTSETGLQNNNIRALLTDHAKNVWAGLSNGITVIHANSPYSVYDDIYGLKSTTLTSFYHKGYLYIGNTTGVYYMDWDNRSADKKTEFKEIENLSVFQIWQLDSIDGTLFGSGSGGIFTIQDNTANFIKDNESIKSFIQLKYRPNIIIGIGGNGLTKMQKNSQGNWGNFKRIRGFNKDYRQIKQAGRNEFWVSSQSKGLVKLTLSEDLDSVANIREYDITDGLPDKLGNQVFAYKNKLIFTTEKGIYNYDRENDIFVPDPYFSRILGKTVAITDFIVDKQGGIWYKEKLDDPKVLNKSNWELGYIKETPDTIYTVKKPFYKIKNNIHSLYSLPENELLIGTESGFVVFDTDYEKDYSASFNALIRKVETIKNDSLIFGGAFSDTSGIARIKQAQDRVPVLSFEFRDIRISFSALFFEEPERTKFKFILEGYDKVWSDWKEESMKEYSNLEPGKYTFRVKAQNLYETESNEAVYQFEILPPYYRTVWAYIIYFILFGFFIWGIVAFSTRRVKKQKENLERIVEERTKQIQAQNKELNRRNEEIKSKNKDITASINYAKRIQDAMLPLQTNIAQAFEDSFIVFKPRDIVSGDFYWFEQKHGKIIITAVDCTGHGVPGAFMSLIGSEILASIVGQNILNASQMLQKMNRYVVAALKQEETANQDGMDMALCVIDPEKKTIDFAGAKNPLVYIHDNDITYIKGDRKGIGGHQETGEFQMHSIRYDTPTYFYIFTDGYQDQFGGPKNRKFMIKRLRNLLLDVHKLPGEKQKQILNETIEDWMKGKEQTDDILLMGFKL